MNYFAQNQANSSYVTINFEILRAGSAYERKIGCIDCKEITFQHSMWWLQHIVSSALNEYLKMDRKWEQFASCGPNVYTVKCLASEPLISPREIKLLLWSFHSPIPRNSTSTGWTPVYNIFQFPPLYNSLALIRKH